MVIQFVVVGSLLGNKVLFDVHCGEFWNSDGYPKLYFSGNNIDPARTVDLVDHIAAEAGRKAGAPCKVTLIVVSKSSSTLDTRSAFMMIYEALKRRLPDSEIAVVAITDPAEGEKATLLKEMAGYEGCQPLPFMTVLAADSAFFPRWDL